MGEWLLHTFREYPSIAIFLTIGVGFWIGQLKYKTFSLGTVTSVLLVGVLVGQMASCNLSRVWKACRIGGL